MNNLEKLLESTKEEQRDSSLDYLNESNTIINEAFFKSKLTEEQLLEIAKEISIKFEKLINIIKIRFNKGIKKFDFYTKNNLYKWISLKESNKDYGSDVQTRHILSIDTPKAINLIIKEGFDKDDAYDEYLDRDSKLFKFIKSIIPEDTEMNLTLDCDGESTNDMIYWINNTNYYQIFNNYKKNMIKK